MFLFWTPWILKLSSVGFEPESSMHTAAYGVYRISAWLSGSNPSKLNFIFTYFFPHGDKWALRRCGMLFYGWQYVRTGATTLKTHSILIHFPSLRTVLNVASKFRGQWCILLSCLSSGATRPVQYLFLIWFYYFHKNDCSFVFLGFPFFHLFFLWFSSAFFLSTNVCHMSRIFIHIINIFLHMFNIFQIHN